MLLFRVEPSENLHGIDDVSLLLRTLPLVLLCPFDIEQATLDDKLLASNALIQTSVVQLDNRVLKLDLLRRVLFEELHVCQKQLGVHIVFLVEVATLGHIADDLDTLLYGRDVGAGLRVARGTAGARLDDVTTLERQLVLHLLALLGVLSGQFLRHKLFLLLPH